MKREDDFEKRRQHLKSLTDEELYEMFWDLTDKIIQPLQELAANHTSPSIERSVLLRMGFSSLEAADIVRYGTKYSLLSKGIGNVVLTYGKLKNMDYIAAGRELATGTGWIEVSQSMRGEN